MDNKLGYSPKYSNSRALIIGIDKYKNASPLSYAVSDANSISELLESRFGFLKGNITTLTDEQATAETIRTAFMRYAEDGTVELDDRILVFFAGHGHTMPGKRGEVGFLVPYDGNPKDLSTLVRWDEFTRNAELIRAKHIFFIMDACYGGLALLRAPTFGSMRFLGDMIQRYSRQVLTAGKADELVADGNGIRPGHSIFTAHLLDALEGGAATEDGVITANGVMAYVYERVSRDHYSYQTPHYGFVDGDGDFIFDKATLDSIKENSQEDENLGRAGQDILVNTSPEIATESKTKRPIQEEMKDLLSDQTMRIRLDDFVTNNVRRLLDAIDLRHFPVQSKQITPETITERIARYDEACRDMQQIVILLTKWGTTEQLQLLERIFTRLAEADKGSSGMVVWIELGWYPVMVLMYTAGITAVATHRYNALPAILLPLIQIEPRNERVSVIVPTVDKLTSANDAFKLLPGYENKFVPRSEYQYKALQPTLEDALHLGKSYEAFFDEFEILFALVYSNRSDRTWGPPGRFAWKESWRHGGDTPLSRLAEESSKAGNSWGPIKAGLYGGSFEEFQKVLTGFKELLPKFNFY